MAGFVHLFVSFWLLKFFCCCFHFVLVKGGETERQEGARSEQAVKMHVTDFDLDIFQMLGGSRKGF